MGCVLRAMRAVGCERGERDDDSGGKGCRFERDCFCCFLYDTQFPPVTPVAWRKPWPEGLDIFSEALEGAK